MNSKLGKEAIILVLLFIVILFVLGILLYDFIPGKKESIKSVEYVADESVSDVLKEIKDNTGVDIQASDSDVPLKSYSIEASDLDVYASEKSYESGKADPFAETSDPAEGIFVKTTTTGTSNQSQSANIQNENKLNDNNKTSEVNNTTKVNSVETPENKAENTVATEKESVVKTPEKTENKTTNTTKSTTGTFFEKPNSK